jgi:transcriptional regulator with XRE-family HTH domain
MSLHTKEGDAIEKDMNSNMDQNGKSARTTDVKLLVRRLEQAMAEKGINAAQLADKLGVTRSAVSYFKNGKRQPGRLMLCRMADILSVTVDYLLGESDEVDLTNLLKNPRIVQLVSCFQELNDRDQQRVLEMVRLIRQTANPAATDLVGVD